MTIRRWHLELFVAEAAVDFIRRIMHGNSADYLELLVAHLLAEAAVGFIRRIMHGNSADYLELLVAHLLAEVAVLELTLQPDGLGGPRLQFGEWG